MEAMAGKGSGSAGGGGTRRRTPHGGNGNGDAKAVPGYLRPSAGSCHHVCKYGGQHAFEGEGQARKLRRQPAAAAPDGQKKVRTTLARARSVSRRRVVDDFGKPEKKGGAPVAAVVAGEEVEEEEVDAVEWKDIVAYDTAPACDQQQHEKISAQVANLRDGKSMKKKKDSSSTKGKRSHEKKATMVAEEEGGVKKKNESMDKKLIKSFRSKLTGKASTASPSATASRAASPSSLKDTSSGSKSVKPPPAKAKKITAASPAVEKKAHPGDEEAADAKLKEGEAQPVHPVDQEHAAAAESSRSIPVHRSTRSMSVSISSRSVRFPFVRQASKNTGATAFKLRSKSSKAAATLPSDEEKPAPVARLRFRKGRPADNESSSGGGGVQLRIRSLRRRGGGANGGFVVPAVALRHQKTLEKKRSQRLYNNLIEETASRLAKTRKSRVKALVGAFETLISKIAK